MKTKTDKNTRKTVKTLNCYKSPAPRVGDRKRGRKTETERQTEKRRKREKEMACSIGKGSGFVAMALVVALVSLMGTNGVAGQQLPGCIGKLLPCSSYLNSTAPPESCCNPLREAFEKEVSCLCGLYNGRESYKSLGINITQILQLPKYCGINYDLSTCNTQGIYHITNLLLYNSHLSFLSTQYEFGRV